MEPPCPADVVERVVVPAHELHCPSAAAVQQEDDIARRAGLVVAPVGEEGVEDEVALRSAGHPPGVRRPERVVAFVRAQPRDVTRPVGAEGGDEVVGPAVVERLRVHRDGGTDPLGDLGVGLHDQNPRSTTGRSSGFTLSCRSAGRSRSYGSPARNPSTVRSKLETPPSIPADRRMYSNPFECRPRCWRGRFEKSCVGMGGTRGSSNSHGSGGGGGSGAAPAGKRVSDQISISVSSGPSGRNRYDDALLYIGSTKKCGKQ